MSFLMAIVVSVIAAIIGLLILSAILRWLWNATIPEVFGLKAVTFWQAVKLMLIAMILFGGPTSAVQFGARGRRISRTRPGRCDWARQLMLASGYQARPDGLREHLSPVWVVFECAWRECR